MHFALRVQILTVAACLACSASAIAQGYANQSGQGYRQMQQQIDSGYPMQQQAPSCYPGGMNQPAQGWTQGVPQPAMGMGGSYPVQSPMQSSPRTGHAKPAGNAPGTMTVAQWFSKYDQIRHAAQMSPAERQRADNLMSKGLSILVPGDEKQATKTLLISLVSRYQRACQQLRTLPQLGATSNLHQEYYQYFATAGGLFSDYARVQDNVFAKDPTGQPIAAGLLQRKQMLEALEHQCKQVDSQTRTQFGVAPYPW